MKPYLFIICIAVFLGISSHSSAQESETVTLLNIHLKDNSTVIFNLPDNPVITFADDEMKVESTTLTASYPRADVSHYDFSHGAYQTALSQATASRKLEVNSNGETLTLRAPELKGALLTDINGINTASATAQNGEISFTLSTLAPGIYIVNAAGFTPFKIKKQ